MLAARKVQRGWELHVERTAHHSSEASEISCLVCTGKYTVGLTQPRAWLQVLITRLKSKENTKHRECSSGKGSFRRKKQALFTVGDREALQNRSPQ